MNRVIVGVGSNINPAENVRRAKQLISEQHTIVKSSHFIKTKPIGFKEQDDFLNGGWLVNTSLDQKSFKKFLNFIEDKLGRKRTRNKYGPRTIDLDILIWNGSVVDDDYYERDFLRVVVKELDDSIDRFR
ncbi:MAG: 2-amino-4-hydroxy-6-hydroxymethyldihydropteridine diphosphokinase [Candidatus Dadabacteria bacterium]|nr:2-amino-4-hydroxy-6-hydroxymethyldihydropteridine diphosphokinase [Candidatus Dadabacteria bacterium]NIS09563.1 2-amino-4-hydroxy-6-hydroxymethyldihydropteridine diphosphokinase [Candidatus Dadabacteria bacterium]NIV43072.1 2-amino-4-hydroxy-6-hydroxymethyldihydropteridine diphosphokinase [Candidatus Dadabacteria bacterium]NIX16037.1 2-amino-4-hydroxy-6-hydroxymethyldihydropteridine diphosphokinase [Candidatus Dadabacteria bacterium]NIY22740.1 2-amino-4-hydroxy-6-hydroxymethyldihydropteridin